MLGGMSAASAFEIVSGPATDNQCFQPWSADTAFYQLPARQGPHRIALANGYDANSWRAQMLKTAKAYAAQPNVAAKLKDFTAVSTGEDVAAQIAAVNKLIDAGYDAIVIDAENPTAFGPVISRANQAGVVLVAFDNTLASTDAINVDVDQKGLGALSAEWMLRHLPNGGRLLEVRGVPGTSVDQDRHAGVQAVLGASGKQWAVTEVIGKWNDEVARKATADAIAKHGPFDGIISQAGDAGAIQAMIAAGHPFVPFAGETENGFRKLCAAHGEEGLKCSSAGTGPAQVAVAMKVAIAALEGQIVPQSIKLPTTVVTYPDFEANKTFYPDQPDGFFVGNAFPACDVDITPEEIAAKAD